MTRRTLFAALSSLFLPLAVRGGKKVKRVLVVFACDELVALFHARAKLGGWHDVNGRKFWPETITKIAKQPFGTEFRFTMEGTDGGEAEKTNETRSYWDYE